MSSVSTTNGSTHHEQDPGAPGAADEIATLRAELARANALIEAIFEHHPDGLALFHPDGSLRTNATGDRMLGTTDPTQVKRNEDGTTPAGWAEGWGFFEADKKTPVALETLPGPRALMQRVEVPEQLMWLVGAAVPQGAMIAASAKPLPGGGAISIFRDVTERATLEADLARRNEDLARRDAENRELIDRLRIALDDLSTPVLEVAEDVLVLPVIGVVDSQRSAQMSERLLAEVVRVKARHVIVDLTGVEIIDTGTADRFAKLARAVELLGAKCVLTGLQPAVARTLVDLGVSFAGLSTRRNLRRALESLLSDRAHTKERRAS